MAFENGIGIMNYIGETVHKYNENKNIFKEAINVLNIYMSRADWPYCFKEYREVSKMILDNDCEVITKYYLQHLSQAQGDDERFKEWDKGLSEQFKNDCLIFSKIISPIIENYYNYINNPMGVKKIIQVNNNDIMKIIRIERNDGKFLDLNLHSMDIEEVSKSLKQLISEEGENYGTD